MRNHNDPALKSGTLYVAKPRSGDIPIAIGVSRWKTVLNRISVVDATDGDCRRYAARLNPLYSTGSRRWLVEYHRYAVQFDALRAIFWALEVGRDRIETHS
jgi:hypothetical protein